jgi:hypothetical protein
LQGLGGIFTTSHVRSDQVAADHPLLVDVQGKLIGAETLKVISRTTKGLAWVNGPHIAEPLVCIGSCAIVLQVDSLQKVVPAELRSAAELKATGFAPWFWSVSLPRGTAPGNTMRFNSRFDKGWLAIDGLELQSHFRVDSAFNGWQLKPSTRGKAIMIVHLPSLLQFLLQCLVIGWTGWLALRLWKAHSANRQLSRSNHTRG